MKYRYIMQICVAEFWLDMAGFLSEYDAQQFCLARLKKLSDPTLIRVFDAETDKCWIPGKDPALMRTDYENVLYEEYGFDADEDEEEEDYYLPL